MVLDSITVGSEKDHSWPSEGYDVLYKYTVEES